MFNELSDYIVNINKLKKIHTDNREIYDFLMNILEKYLLILNNMNDVDIIGKITINYMPEYRGLIENTLINEGILIKKRIAKIDKILNS